MRTIFLDVTGVTTSDDRLAQVLRHTTAAARLLGVQPVVVGVRPELAEALVQVGLDGGRVVHAASLATGLGTLFTRRMVRATRT